jgi:hypothetical protein
MAVAYYQVREQVILVLVTIAGMNLYRRNTRPPRRGTNASELRSSPYNRTRRASPTYPLGKEMGKGWNAVVFVREVFRELDAGGFGRVELNWWLWFGYQWSEGMFPQPHI